MNTCQTCRFWTPLASDAIKQFAIRHNDNTIAAIFRDCTHPLMSVRSRNQEALGSPSAALGMQNELTAPIITGPQFGCIHHEPT